MNSVKSTAQFNRIYKKGRYAHTSGFVLYYMKGSENLLGVVASKKVGNAVKRNRAKRLLRASLRDQTIDLAVGSYVLVAKAAIFDLPYENLQEELTTALKKVGAVVAS